ncbi:MAG: hypothetical protein ACHQK8_03715 [Bacteroidia bacterium]
MRKVVAIILAVLTLAFSLKVNVALHYCGGKLVQSKFLMGFNNATCGMETGKNKCKNTSSSSTNDINCCKNQLQQINTDDYKIAYDAASLFPVLTQAIFQRNLSLFGKVNTIENFVSYRPPPGLTAVSLSFIKIFLI